MARTGSEFSSVGKLNNMEGVLVESSLEKEGTIMKIRGCWKKKPIMGNYGLGIKGTFQWGREERAKVGIRLDKMFLIWAL